MGASRHNFAMLAAFGASAAAHVAAGWWAGAVYVASGEGALARAGGQRGAAMQIRWADDPAEAEAARVEPPAPAKVEEEAKPREVRLGIAQSPHDTENWIGFADPTPHSAPKSEVDQPALDPDAGNPGRAAPVVVAAGDSRSAPERPGAAEAAPSQAAPAAREAAAAAQAAAERARETKVEAMAESVREGEAAGARSREASAVVAGAPEEGRDDAARPLVGEVPQRVEAAASEREAAFVGPPREAAPAAAAASSPGEAARREIARTESGTQNPGAAPGERSERESNAVSRETAIEVRPGRPAAAEGLEIITRRPEFSRVTRLMAAPARNPRLRVTFDREGLVRNVEFIESTGIRDVDDPVQHAVYRWTARGRALTELPASDPRAGVTITVTILLR
jgi:hypothetical protein